MFEKFTERAKGMLQAAQTIAVREGNQQFLPEHLLKALLDDPEVRNLRAQVVAAQPRAIEAAA